MSTTEIFRVHTYGNLDRRKICRFQRDKRKNSGGGIRSAKTAVYVCIAHIRLKRDISDAPRIARSSTLNTFAVALGIVSCSVLEDKQSELYDLLTGWAKNNLADFPDDLALWSFAPIDEFPEIIEEKNF